LPRRLLALDGKKEPRPRVTVCIAAICTWFGAPAVVGASDRMLTAGDIIEFEPPQTKVATLSHFCAALYAGDASVQSSIFAATYRALAADPKADVESIARVYADQYAKFRLESAERKYLRPFGLTSDTFLRRQRELSPDLVEQLNDRIFGYDLGADAIITGADNTGCHIYVVSDPGQVTCHDAVGFASIGIGQAHADPQFMFAKYTKQWSFPRAAFMTYLAKKRAEVAPGVGAYTDMLYITSAPPGVKQIADSIVNDNIEPIYAAMLEKANAATNEAMQSFEDWVTEFLKKANQSQPPEATPPISTNLQIQQVAEPKRRARPKKAPTKKPIDNA
jgi:hypothetical protein